MTERASAPEGYTWHDIDLVEPRHIEVLASGPEDGTAFIFHSGTPTGAAPFPLLADGAAERGLRMITYSRPGYGTSTTALGRRVAQAASDAELIVAALGHTSFVTAGWSGGGPHALACAAGAGNCLGAGVVAGVAPYDSQGLDWMEGMANENLEEFNLALGPQEAFTSFLEVAAQMLRLVSDPNEASGLLGELVTERDIQALGLSGIGDYLLSSMQQAVLEGTTGWRDDDLAFLSPWGVAVSTIDKPVGIWHGTEDKMVPLSHGRWLAEHIATAELHTMEGEGHISLVPEVAHALLDFLAVAAKT